MANFSNEDCGTDGVKPFEPLLFTCEVNGVVLLRVVLPTGDQEMISVGDTAADVMLPIIGHLAFASFLDVVLSHLISPPFKRKALSIESVSVKFLVDSSISVIVKDIAEKPVGKLSYPYKFDGKKPLRSAAPVLDQYIASRHCVSFTLSA